MKRSYSCPELQVMHCTAFENLSTDIDVSGGDIVVDTSEGMDGW